MNLVYLLPDWRNLKIEQVEIDEQTGNLRVKCTPSKISVHVHSVDSEARRFTAAIGER